MAGGNRKLMSSATNIAPEGSVTFTVTAQDVTDAHRAWFGPYALSRRTVLGYLVLCLAIGVIGMMLAARDGAIVAGGTFGGAFLGGVAGVIAVMLLSWWSIAHRARRVWAQQKSLRALYSVRWQHDAISIVTPSMTAHHPWSDFIRWHENDKTIMIYQSDAMFNFIPKSALSPAALADFRACVTGAGIPKARWFGP